MSIKPKRTQFLMAILLIGSLLAPAVLQATSLTMYPSTALATDVHQAALQPVRVIVQKSGLGHEAEDLVQAVGGKVLKDLHLINAFAAEISVDALSSLEGHEAIMRVSLDAPVISTGKGGGGKGNSPGPDKPLPTNYFLDTLGVRQVWEMGYRGEGITVVVIDSGVHKAKDLQVDPSTGQPDSRLLLRESFNPDSQTPRDVYGHGTHVAGIIGGSGHKSDGAYAGIAPAVNLISLKISDENGMAYESDTVDALQWVFDHKETFNIRVVNLSIQSTVEQVYHDSALDAAAEILWFNGVVVVASAGNKGHGDGFNTIHAAPANDPFIITVGASDERDSPNRNDDRLAPFTAHGFTPSGQWKPEIIAPGQDIVSLLSPESSWEDESPERAVLGNDYFRLSGTSMAAPMVSGAAALLLQAEPDLTPDQVKYRLQYSGDWIGSHRYLNVYAALTTPTTGSANQGVIPHMLLAKMAMIAYWSSQNGEENIDWAAVDWDAVNWDAVDWEAVNWNAVNWNAVNWNAVNWNAVNWNAVNWNAVNWNAVNWNAVNWNAVNWNAVNWNAVNWNAVNWGN